MEEKKQYIERSITDAILERPHYFSVTEHADRCRRFALYPPSVGVRMLTSSYIADLGILPEADAYTEAVRVSADNADTVCRIVAIHTFYNRRAMLDPAQVARRADYFKKHLDADEQAQLLIYILSEDNTATYMKHLGIDKEHDTLRRISEAKSDRSSVSFGARSIYGSLLDRAMERYGWTMQYCLWGISYTNLTMLLADAQQDVYLTKEERKSLHITSDRTRIDGSDPKNAALIAKLLKG